MKPPQRFLYFRIGDIWRFLPLVQTYTCGVCYPSDRIIAESQEESRKQFLADLRIPGLVAAHKIAVRGGRIPAQFLDAPISLVGQIPEMFLPETVEPIPFKSEHQS